VVWKFFYQIKEDDKFPKQICLSCLNKLDTSYELYSGSLNAENTIKRLLKDCNQTGSAEDNLPVETSIKQGQNDVSVISYVWTFKAKQNYSCGIFPLCLRRNIFLCYVMFLSLFYCSFFVLYGDKEAA
jgi:hypothetical protein